MSRCGIIGSSIPPSPALPKEGDDSSEDPAPTLRWKEELSPPSTERGPSLLPSSLLKPLQLLWSLVGMHTSYRHSCKNSPAVFSYRQIQSLRLIPQQEKAEIDD